MNILLLLRGCLSKSGAELDLRITQINCLKFDNDLVEHINVAWSSFSLRFVLSQFRRLVSSCFLALDGSSW